MVEQKKLSVGVVLASLGRPAELASLLQRLEQQTLPPHLIVLSVTKAADTPADARSAVVVTGSAGLPAQRNRGMILALEKCDIVAFFDDDYIPSRHAIEGIADLFSNHPDIAGATGTLLADGICTGGISVEQATYMVDAFDQEVHATQPEIIERDHGLYGCNMAYRCSAVGELRFDENLPLYAWQEDMDFAALIMRRGRIVKSNSFVGVHCGVTTARTRGLRIGYSQIANPTYLVKKGTMTFGYALQLMARNFIANHAKAFFPEPWMDRVGRVKGNWVALGDLLTGKLDPGRILALPK